MNGGLDDTKVNVVVMFLIGSTKLWWRNMEEYLAKSKEIEWIENKDQMNATLKAQFGPRNQGWISCNGLMKLKHTERV